MKIPFIHSGGESTRFSLGEENETEADKRKQNSNALRQLSGYYIPDLKMLKEHFGVNKSGDVKFREFTVEIDNTPTDACVFFIDGLIDTASLNNFVLLPMMVFSRKVKIKSVNEIATVLIAQTELSEEKQLEKLAYNLNFGSAVILVNGLDGALCADIKGWESKSVGEPQSEKVIRGPNDAFNEQIRVNTALIRRLIRNQNLIIEEKKIGKISRTPCSVFYMKNIANDALVNEVLKRVEGIDADYVMTSAELEMYIEEKSYSSIPQFISTERPDRTAKALLDGKVAVMVDGSPFALLMPVTFGELTESMEDSYLRVPYANMMRIIRFIAFGLSVFLPGIYIAIMNFHNELLPTNLLIAIISAKEEVPFPAFVELLLMEISLEIIREAGVRVPTPAGSTLSIVGALILGQAAVEAKIVSPVVIIVVSLAAIGSLATPNYYLGLSARVMKFAYIFLGGFGGLVGIVSGMYIHALMWTKTRSLGVGMFAPFAPKTDNGGLREIFVKPIWKREERNDYQNTKRKYKEAKISRKWKY